MTGIGELDRTVPRFSSRFSVFNEDSDLEHGGELQDVIAPNCGREEIRNLSQNCAQISEMLLNLSCRRNNCFTFNRIVKSIDYTASC